jgi:hypothetical protein
VLLSPARIELGLDTKSLMAPNRLGQLEERSRATKAALGKVPWSIDITLTPKPIRLGAALLEMGKQGGVNLVYYVSPFTDTVVPGPEKTRMAELLADVEVDRVPSAFPQLVVQERVGSSSFWQAGRGLRFPRRLTVDLVNGYAVVRNEQRFLDELCASPSDYPTSFANRLAAAEPVPLAEVCRAALNLPVRSWPSSLFATNYLHFCNPLSFRPFAAAILRSSALTQIMKRGSGELDWTAMEPAARDALVAALSEAAPLNDAFAPPSGAAPYNLVEAPQSLRGSRSAMVKVTRVNDRWELTLLADGGTRPIWISWVTNVAP